MHPTSADEFAEFRQLVADKFESISASRDYNFFLEELLRDLCVPMNLEDVRKLSKVMTVMVNEKQKAEKAARGGPKKKSTKPAIKKDHGGFGGYDDDDLADFM